MALTEAQKQQIVIKPFEIQMAEAFEAARAEAMANRLDETEPGGRYALADGTEVDADGRVLAKRDAGAMVGDGLGTHAATTELAHVGEGEQEFPEQQEGLVEQEDGPTAKRNARLGKQG